MKIPVLSPALALILAAGLTASLGHAQSGPAMAPRPLFDPTSGTATTQVTPNPPDFVSTEIDKDGILVTVQPGKPGYPGISIKPAEGKTWDLAAFGHVEARVTNLGEKPMAAILRVDGDGDWKENPWNSSNTTLKPGESKTLTVIFGYNNSEPGYKLDAKTVKQIMVFTGKSEDTIRKFRIDTIEAAGAPGDKPAVDPKTVRVRPENGVIFGDKVKLDATKQISAKGGAKGTLTPDGKALKVEFTGGKPESVSVKPAMGMWNLNDAMEVKVKVKNTGSQPVTPSVQVESKSGNTAIATAKAPIAPNAEGEIAVTFEQATPWKGETDPQQDVEELKKNWKGTPGTGTQFSSNQANAVTVISDQTSGPAAFEVTSIVSGVPPLELPEWLGKRPPVEGDWVQTFDDNFDGGAIDSKRWNIYTNGGNPWDTRTHFSKDNVIVKDGHLNLRTEKKTGPQNDAPDGKVTNYAAGYADTLGKWTQRYGYFEARVKLPTAPAVWPAFWLMPDRGIAVKDIHQRTDTKKGGMEFDIMEFLSTWGVHRYNIAMHWDGYVKYHKATGTGNNYVQADKDGYVVSGLLWTPGLAVFYGNGKEIARWETPRMASVQSYMILTHVMGGWEREAIDDAQFPADFTVDYVRVWQRKDLATPEDGPKPNDGGPTMPKP